MTKKGYSLGSKRISFCLNKCFCHPPLECFVYLVITCLLRLERSKDLLLVVSRVKILDETSMNVK